MLNVSIDFKMCLLTNFYLGMFWFQIFLSVYYCFKIRYLGERNLYSSLAINYQCFSLYEYIIQSIFNINYYFVKYGHAKRSLFGAITEIVLSLFINNIISLNAIIDVIKS